MCSVNTVIRVTRGILLLLLFTLYVTAVSMPCGESHSCHSRMVSTYYADNWSSDGPPDRIASVPPSVRIVADHPDEEWRDGFGRLRFFFNFFLVFFFFFLLPKSETRGDTALDIGRNVTRDGLTERQRIIVSQRIYTWRTCTRLAID